MNNLSDIAIQRTARATGFDIFWIAAYDGTSWASAEMFVFDANQAPIATGNTFNVANATSTGIGAHIAASDINPDSVTEFQFWDDHYALSTGDDNPSSDTSGDFTVNGVRQSEGVCHRGAAADLGNVAFTGGLDDGTDILWVRAFDGREWGAWDRFDGITV